MSSLPYMHFEFAYNILIWTTKGETISVDTLGSKSSLFPFSMEFIFKHNILYVSEAMIKNNNLSYVSFMYV